MKFIVANAVKIYQQIIIKNNLYFFAKYVLFDIVMNVVT